MSLFHFGKKIIEKKKEKEADKNLLAFEKREKVHPLILFFTIVNRNQSTYYTKAYSEAGASMSIVLYSHSQPPQEIANMLGPDNLKKEIVITVAREEDISKLKTIAENRFKISNVAKGIAFACPIDSVSGITAYKFLADQNRDVRVIKNEQWIWINISYR